MSPKNAIDEIKKLLKFGNLPEETIETEFATVYLEDGQTQVTNNKEGDFELGDIIYVLLDFI